MEIETCYNGKRYTLSNDNLNVGDNVYPIGIGRCSGNKWILSELDFSKNRGFPLEPQKILNLKYDDYKPYKVQISFGFSSIESLYKIIKIEEKVKVQKNNLFTTYEWINLIEVKEEIPSPELIKEHYQNI